MDHMTHQVPGQADRHTGHNMSNAHGGHDRHAGHSVAMFRDKFWLSLALTIPVVAWSTDVQHWLGYTAPSFPGSKFIPAILGTVVFIYGGLVFIRGAWGELADHKPGMMTLISLAIIVAFGTSLAATFGLFEIDVWWELASLITIMVLGHWLEMRAISQARGALNALAALLPNTAERVSGAETQTVPISELRVGDVVLVRPGTRVPADGTVVEGSAEVDESMITGESRAVLKGPGGAVIAGTVASGGSLRVRITATGEQTALSGIMRLVAAAQASGSRTQALADRAAAILFYVAIASGAITLAYWWLSGDKEHALIRTATKLTNIIPLSNPHTRTTGFQGTRIYMAEPLGRRAAHDYCHYTAKNPHLLHGETRCWHRLRSRARSLLTREATEALESNLEGGSYSAFPKLCRNSSAFGIAAPRAVLSKIHHIRAPASKLAICATSIFRESLE